MLAMNAVRHIKWLGDANIKARWVLPPMYSLLRREKKKLYVGDRDLSYYSLDHINSNWPEKWRIKWFGKRNHAYIDTDIKVEFYIRCGQLRAKAMFQSDWRIARWF